MFFAPGPFVTKRNQIKGLTTAAGIWAAAAVGLAIGIGFYEGAILGGIAVFFVLSVIHSWDNRMHRNSRFLEIYVELTSVVNLGMCMRRVSALELEIENVQMEHDDTLENGVRSFIITLKSSKKQNHEVLLSNIRSIEGVAYLEGL